MTLLHCIYLATPSATKWREDPAHLACRTVLHKRQKEALGALGPQGQLSVVYSSVALQFWWTNISCSFKFFLHLLLSDIYCSFLLCMVVSQEEQKNELNEIVICQLEFDKSLLLFIQIFLPSYGCRYTNTEFTDEYRGNF